MGVQDVSVQELASIPGLAWDGMALAADEAAVSRTRRPYLSPSSSSRLQQCPARYMADRQLPRSHDPFGAAELGTSAHHVFERLFNLPHHERTKENARATLSDMASPDREPPTEFDRPDPTQDAMTLRLWQSEVWRRVQGLWKIEDPAYVQVRRTEWELSVEVAGVPFYGFVDRVDAVTDEAGVGFSVVDFKGGLAKPKLYIPPGWGDDYGDQIRLYAEAVKVFDGNLPNSGHLYFTAHGRCRTVDLSADKRKDTLSRFVQAFETAKQAEATGRYRTNPGPLCGWCPLVDSCPAAAADGRTRSDRYTGSVAEDLPVITPPETPVAVGAEVDVDMDVNFGTGDEPARTAHVAGINDDRPEESAVTFSHEDKPWNATVAGGLNPNSYSATAAFGLVSFAVAQLDKGDQPITKDNVQALSGTFAHIIGEAMEQLDATRDMQAGLHTRLRGALHTTIETLDVPFGDTTEAWNLWVEAAIRRVIAIAKVSASLWSDGYGEAPWTDLGVDEPLEEADPFAA